MQLTLREEYALNETICSLHPHKKLLENWLPRYRFIREKTTVIRKGWGKFKSKYANIA